MSGSAMQPVAEAVFAKLQDATLDALLSGGSGVRGWPPIEEHLLPVLYVETSNAKNERGLGTTPKRVELDIRTHAFSRYGSLSQAQAIDARAVVLLQDAALTVTGYDQCGPVFYDGGGGDIPFYELGGVLVHEIVSLFRAIVEETS